jgi:hypothetical protein
MDSKYISYIVAFALQISFYHIYLYKLFEHVIITNHSKKLQIVDHRNLRVSYILRQKEYVPQR